MKRGAVTSLQILIYTTLIGAVLVVGIMLMRHSAARNAESISAVENGYINKAIN